MITYLYYGSLVILIPGIILSVVAQILIKRTFAKYSKVNARSGITADEASRRLLRDYGCGSVSVRPISGNLTDNYNPSTDVLSLSQSVYGSSSIASLGVAAHECGHACQKHSGSFLLRFRSILVPVTNIGSRLAVPVALLGVILEAIIGGTGYNFGSYVLFAGVMLYSLTTIFALVTLPVELNASSRAIKMLKEEGMLTSDEIPCARKVLTSAALTYVASLVVSFLYLIRFILMLTNMRGRRNR